MPLNLTNELDHIRHQQYCNPYIKNTF